MPDGGNGVHAMTAGTIAVFYRTHVVRHARLLLFDAAKADTIEVGAIHPPARALHQVLQALCATAPTPTLSEEDLVG